MMPKGDTIAEIMRINRSARLDFLDEFSPDDLSRYLDRLGTLRSAQRSTKDSRASASPGAAAPRAAIKGMQKDAPFRFTSDTTRV